VHANLADEVINTKQDKFYVDPKASINIVSVD
jgi:hypothetical protein